MHAAVHAANSALAALATLVRSGPAPSGERLVPGIWVDLDPSGGAGDVMAKTGGGLLKLTLAPRTAGRWCTLNIDLGNAPPDGAALLGVALRSRAPQSTTARLAVRSFLPGGGMHDSFFGDHLGAVGTESTHCDVLWLAHDPVLQADADWRTLLLFFDPEGFDISLMDMRLFAA